MKLRKAEPVATGDRHELDSIRQQIFSEYLLRAENILFTFLLKPKQFIYCLLIE